MSFICQNDVFGFIKPSIDAHTIGINYVAKLIRTCGYQVVIGDRSTSEAVNQISKHENIAFLSKWIHLNKIKCLGLSYRLDPEHARELFGRLHYQLDQNNLMSEKGGPIKRLYFAGLPEACEFIYRKYDGKVSVFCGEETPAKTLKKLGIPPEHMVRDIIAQSTYDDMRMNFGRKLVADGYYRQVRAVDHSGYPEYGSFKDNVIKRLAQSNKYGLTPLIRAHMGPYLDNRHEALSLLKDWIGQLRREGLLDVLSLGTSQLTQSNFGEEWGDKPNGGGIPVNSEAEYHHIWKEARPMLVRVYAGTKRVDDLAHIHERSLNNAWHALSFWWFSQIDGRGPNSVYTNLCEHLKAIEFIAKCGKPFEPNVPHHFSFRGADDVTYILSAYLAAKTAKMHGIKYLILQNMLNTPKVTSGIQDLAKSRAMLKLIRSLEDDTFRVILQPRAGLECFSADIEKAKAQLASVTALMDDIEPGIESSPPIIHVVGYSEALCLADPPVINESIRIVIAALKEYRRQRKKGNVPNMAEGFEVTKRAERLYNEVLDVLGVITRTIKNPFSPEGLYKIFAAGFLPVPYLWENRDEFKHATEWKTDIINGEVRVVNEQNELILPRARAEIAASRLPYL